MAPAEALAPELQRRVIMFNCGDEKYAGEWLLEFRRADGAWAVCTEALRAGRPTCCDEELLQEFCAQTLAHLSRSFRSRLPETAWQPARDGLEALLAMHAEGDKATWKQLALALTCADLWLGRCVVGDVIAAATLPVDIRNELLILPTELLFSDRALPLDDVNLRRTAAMSLFTSCDGVFPFLLQRIDGQSLQVLASWLRAARKSLRLLVGCQETAPLRKLVEHAEELSSAVQIWPSEACEVAQELALWPTCDGELASVLGATLKDLFSAHLTFEREVMLPLLQDLAGNCWPRAALGDLDLDWQSISLEALKVIHSTLDDTEADSTDVEAALSVWQTFAATLCKGQDDIEQPSSGKDGVFEPRQKRSRRRDQWCASRDRLARCQALPQLFSHFIEQLLERLRAPEYPAQDDLVTLWEMREAARPAIAAWAALLGEAHAQAKAAQLESEAQAWFEAAWSPLHRLCQSLATCDTPLSDEICSGAEIVMWFSATLALSWPDQAEAVPVKQVLPALGAIDTAPFPWKPLLWSSACSFAAKAPAEHCLELLQWMLERSPVSIPRMFDHPVTDHHELTELLYFQALEVVSKQLPSGMVHMSVGDRFASMAMDTFPCGTGHKDSAKAQAALLLALRHAMGSDPLLLCQGLKDTALPIICEEVNREEEVSASENDPPWNAAQALFSVLRCSLPEGLSTDAAHPSGALWKEHWRYLEGALLYWPQSAVTEQPASAALEALTASIRALPVMMPDVLQLVSQSAKMHQLPDVQLAGLRDIALAVPCPPVDAAKAADLLATTILGVSSDLLMKVQDVLQSPSTLCVFFKLLAEAMSAAPVQGKDGMEASRGLYEGKLRLLLLAAPDFVERCLELAGECLAERCSEGTVVEIFRFAAGIVALSGESGSPHQQAVIAVLPALCTAVCRAMAVQECLIDLDVLGNAAEVLTLAAVGYGSDFAIALGTGLDIMQVPMFNRERLQNHVAACAAWGASKMEWLEQLQQIVREWQNERRHNNV